MNAEYARKITFEVHGKPHTIQLPEKSSDDVSSAFIVGLPKAGSTLLNRIMNPLCQRAGLTLFSLPNTLRNLGLTPDLYPKDFSPLFTKTGYVYSGFRGWITSEGLPEFASGRTVFLVRDPRDMLVSGYFSEAFSHRPPGSVADDSLAKHFETRRQEVKFQSVDTYALQSAENVRRVYENTISSLDLIEHRTWKYEDIIFQKRQWVDEMLEYLDMRVPDAVVSRIVERQDVKPSEEAVSEHVRKVTPGDHKQKLQPETIEKLNKVFQSVMDRYGYV